MRLFHALISLTLLHSQLLSGQLQVPQPKLSIVVLQGEGAINNIRTRTATAPIVRVNDESGQPVSGAVVTFVLPAQGASAEFADGQSTVSIPTDQDGKAVIRALRPNAVPGKVEMRVNASHNGQTAHAVLTQFNMMVPGGGTGSGKTVAILALLGAAAAGGVVAATQMRNGSGNTVAPPVRPGPIVITPGTNTAGPPF